MTGAAPLNVFTRSQASACVAMFGSPVVSTVNPAVSVAFSTTTETVPYTDIVISVSTTFSTSQETVTSYTTLYETVTSFTATSVSTVSTVVTAAPQPAKKKRSHNKRGKVLSNSSAAPAVISSAPAITSTSSSSAPAISSTTTSSAAPLFPIAPNCPSRDEYSSACACIGAVSSTSTVTAAAPVSTSTVTETTSTAVSSVSTSVVTVIRTSTVTAPVQATTLTATSAGLFLTTTTATSTTTPAAATQTAKVIVVGGASAGKYLFFNGGYVQLTTNAPSGETITIPSAGGPISLLSNPNKQLYLYLPGVSAGTLYFETATAAANNGDLLAICTAAAGTGIITCGTPSVCNPLTLKLSA
ncbi:hypothetical protein B0T22DRAFT_518159 [Podospora appendiculata]|uniref:Uncharacterized protein n=1 Tax=Podospora appendiculata TaxID=314037 RepID=A0AAE0X6F5_9PEZI|nr:hypothetical protein B0T22DRAFT_518159 [Podospora appendiculata]